MCNCCWKPLGRVHDWELSIDSFMARSLTVLLCDYHRSGIENVAGLRSWIRRESEFTSRIGTRFTSTCLFSNVFINLTSSGMKYWPAAQYKPSMAAVFPFRLSCVGWKICQRWRIENNPQPRFPSCSHTSEFEWGYNILAAIFSFGAVRPKIVRHQSAQYIRFKKLLSVQNSANQC